VNQAYGGAHPEENPQNPQWYSRSSRPQLRLVPSMPDNRKFPDMGTIGDFFLGMTADQEANLYICLKINPETHKPVWTLVMLDPVQQTIRVDVDGGSDM
jgi:hypothetical protein